MADSATIESLIDYFKKLQKIIRFESDFSFLGYKLIKKTKIDDVLCCILATLPEPYKKIMKMKEGKKLSSVLAYGLLFNSVKQKFFLNPNVYLVSYNDATKYINTILRDLERDISYAEKHIS